MNSAEPPPLPPSSPRSRWPFGNFPGTRRKKNFIIIGGIVTVVIIIVAIIGINFAIRQNQQTTISEFAPDVKFIKFESGKQVIHVGESTNISFNVENSESRIIDNAKVVVTVEPEVGYTYLTIRNSTTILPVMNPNARTGDMEVTITATGTPAKEALYVIKGLVSIGGTATDVRELQLSIQQQ
jgi:hypothetical protein